MILITAVILAISFFDIRGLWKNGLKKEIVFFIVFALSTLVYGYYYALNKNTASIIRDFFDLVGYKY